MPIAHVVLIAAVILLIALGRAYTDVDDAFVREWAEAHALHLTDANRPMVRWYLHTARVLRTWGVLGGLVLPWMFMSALGIGQGGFWPLWAFVGYLAGALYAEVALVRLAPTGERRALLEPREVTSYLPLRLYVGPAIFGLALLALAVVSRFLSYNHAFGSQPPPEVRSAPLAGLVAAAVPLLIAALQRWLIRRPQPYTEPELIAADDAIRSQSVHSLAGAGLAIQFLSLTTIAAAFQRSDVQVLRWTMWVPTILGFVAAVYACLYFGHRAWRVRRHSLPRATTAAP